MASPSGSQPTSRSPRPQAPGRAEDRVPGRGPSDRGRALAAALIAVATLAGGAAVGREVGRGTHAGRNLPLPAAFPEPEIPNDNPFSAAKAELGRHLFYDRRLSGNGTFSCASCHQQERAFTDGRATALGSTGEAHRRNTMSLANVLYGDAFNWADATTRSLEQQALVPMLGVEPVEMGMAGHEPRILRELGEDSYYREQFALAFPSRSGDITMENVARAIATFERTLISFDTPYDRFVRDGDRSALSTDAVRGLELFFSERLSCSTCHSGFLLAGNSTWFGREETVLEFHNTGLYNLGRGSYPAGDTGRHEATGRPRDMGRFKAPTLRNIELTAPYMHDGSLETLEEVLAHYSAGGRTIHSGPYRGVGERNRFKSPSVRPLGLSPAEIHALLAFLRALTDHDFVADPRFADPRDESRE